MLSRIILGQNHQQSTGNDSIGLHSNSVTHGVLIRQPDYCVTFMCQQFLQRIFTKNEENFKRELCLNVFIPFSIIAWCLVVT